MANMFSPLHAAFDECTTNTGDSRAIPGFIPQLDSFPDDELFDLIVAGFGPAALAIAIALHDSLEQSNGNGITGRQPRVLFLEKQASFAWHAGMLIPGAKMQISFIKDMATLRNPLSKFTFLNYLHNNKRMVEFSNLNTFLPTREEFEDYLGWCACHFQDVVRYGEKVESIIPPDRLSSTLDHLTVQSRSESGEMFTRRAKHVVVAIGGYPDIPQPFKSSPHSRYIHSSQYNHNIAKYLPDPKAAYSVAVVGGGQSAAEIFHDLHARYPASKTCLLLRGSALRPSDDSPFVNEIFDPDRIARFFDSPSDVRAAIRNSNRNTNYGVVRQELLEELYATMFLQRINTGVDQDAWQHRIMRGTRIHHVDFADPGRLAIDLEYASDVASHPTRQTVPFDLVIFATGYRHDGYQKLLEPLTEVFGPTDQWAKASKDYRVLLPGSARNDCGVWLQGCNEATHGLADTLLSGLAVRGGQLVQSIFGESQKPAQARL
ncbi:L-ornithine N5-oxygenase sida [Microthyrium microscopicum]|uniref:L-ornithine N(5)-monooxygenase [NAD(P)H] n=1 Tax=Microthyrium microscopicum TaxID=703497 RepID=A0A6A6U624_9PEZI|nr:L-ornithine N5-oxygenase sida [Microthyrium microscopicum]